MVSICQPCASASASSAKQTRDRPRKASLLDVISSHRFVEGAVETRDEVIEEGVEESQLVGEMVQQPAFADTRRLRYGVEGHRGDALLQRQACRNLQQLPADALRLLLPGGGACHGP